ncbi:MAG: CRTAC1 family protein, partial [Phycisphaerae bacterium]
IAKTLAELPSAVASNDAPQVRRIIAVTENVLRATDRYRADALVLAPLGERLPSPIDHPLLPLSGQQSVTVAAEIRFTCAAQSSATHIDVQPPNSSLDIGAYTEARSPALLFADAANSPRLYVPNADTKRFENIADAAGLQDAPPSHAARFFDLNNDRLMDIVFCAVGGVQVWIANESGQFTSPPTGNYGFSSDDIRDVVPFDVDHDGDLDLLAWDTANLFVIANDGAGGLSLLDVPTLPASLPNIAAILPRDFDDDGDIDLLIASRDADAFRWRMFSNERRVQYRDINAQLGWSEKSFAAIPQVGDLDNDGWYDILDGVPQRSHEPIRVYKGGAAWSFTASRLKIGSDKVLRLGTLADIDNDGTLDAICTTSDDRLLLVTSPPGERNSNALAIRAPDGADFTKVTGLRTVDLNDDGLLDLVTNTGVVLMNETANAGHWLSVGLKANIQGDSRFNAFGIGSNVELRCGPLYQKRFADGPFVHFGLGPYPRADVLRILWPNGTYQNLSFRAFDRMDLAGDQVLIQEQTLKGSCPYLYVWNGTRFEFVTDVLWRSALGMPLAANVLGHHWTSDDYFKVPQNLVAPHDGEFVFQFVEELWETPYFDYCRLFVVDHPANVEIYLDESCRWPPYPK